MNNNNNISFQFLKTSTPKYFSYQKNILEQGEEEREDSDKTDSFLKSSEIYSKNTRQRKDEQSLRLAGLRRNSLLLLFIWLGVVATLALILLIVSF